MHVKVGNGTEGFDATFSTGASAPTAANHYTFSGTLPSTAGLSTTALQLTSLTVPAGADIHNGSNTALTQSTYMLNSSGYTVDTSAPTLTITRDQSVLKKGQTSTITFTFSEATTDFVSSDITVTGGTLGTLNGSGTSRTAIFTPDADNNAGNASITVALGNYSDAAGNPGTPGTTPTLTFDTKAPTLTITSDQSVLKKGQTSTITFTFSEATTDFVSSDITVTGGTLGTLNGSGTSRTAIFTPDADNNAGNASITVALGNYSDAAGNPGTPGTTPTLTFDTKAPTLTITSDKSALRAGQTSTITFTFSEATTDFVSSDITVTGGTLGTLNGSGTSRTAIFTPDADNNAGNASITVALGNYSDAAGNPGTPGTTPTLTFDTKAPTLTITSDKSALRAGQTSTITFTFSEATTDFVSSDITVTGGTLGTLNGSGTSRTAIFTPDADNNAGNASITVALGNYSDAAGNPGTPGTTPTLTFDTKAPTLTITSDTLIGTTESTGQTSTITFHLQPKQPHDFVSSDITVTGSTVTLTLATPLAAGASAKISYTDPANDQATGVVQDVAGNDLALY